MLHISRDAWPLGKLSDTCKGYGAYFYCAENLRVQVND
jgi:hypothetical protein